MKPNSRNASCGRLPRFENQRRHLRRAAAHALESLEPRRLLAGTVVATLIHDTNGNGIADAGEPPLQGWTVFVDYDRDTSLDAGEPSAVSGADGRATITGVTDNTWDVREVVPAGYTPATGFKDVDRVRVHDGQTTSVSFLNVTIGSGTTGAIQGTVWNDIGRDGVRDAGDPGIPGWTVFLDLNTDRILGAGEPSTVTDANGFYSFTGLAPARYHAREITPAGWDPTVGFDGQNTVDVAAGQTRVADFGNFNIASLGSIRGTVWNDVDANGVRAAGEPGLGGWTVFLDLNHDTALGAGEPSTVTDAAGVYTFPSIAVGNYLVTEVLQPDWNLSPGHPIAVTATAATEIAGVADFANYTPTLGSISGQVWNDLDGNGFIGAGEVGLVGWKVFIDSDGDGAPGATEPFALSDSSGNYTITGVAIGSAVLRDVPAVGWTPTAPGTGMQLVTVMNGSVVSGVNFGNKQRTDGAIGGIIFADTNGNGIKDAAERGLAGIPLYLDLNNDGVQDPAEPSTTSSADLFYTPAVNEAGTYSFTHLANGVYHVREIVPDVLSATPASVVDQAIDLAVGEQRTNVNFADVYRPNEIHGVVFDDVNQNHVRDAGEPGIPGVWVYLDGNRNNIADPSEPRTVTDAGGAYAFVTALSPGAYVVRALHHSGRDDTYPGTVGGILWPAGVSNPTIGDVTPTSITTSLAEGQSEPHTVSLTLPPSGALTNMVDVFLLFDDTGSFTANSPIVRAAFPQIISTLQAALPGIDLGFGVGRFEEYANFAAELPTGRPFILNQPIIASSTPGFATAIQSALDRMAPGYGGDQPETDVEALYQMATGRGFDGNNNGTTSDSGAAGLVSTQLTPGGSGDVPSFASFTVDPSGNVLPASGSIGGAGFRPGALPIILTATDTGFAFQPKGETSISGLSGLTLPISAFTQTSRPTTPFASGAGIQETITALNALGALVIGLGTNGVATVDPRQGLEAFATLTGAVNHSAVTIPNGTLDPIAPGDPLYFQISSGFGASVANGVVTAIENAVSNVSVNLTVRASDPRVQISSTPAVINNVGAGQTATFDVTFTGDGRPHRFDLQFVREGTDVVLGSIPVVIGTPIPGDGYEYVELEDGQIQHAEDFGDSYNPALPVNVAPSFVEGADVSVAYNAGAQTIAGWATSISPGPASDAGQAVEFLLSSDNGGLFSAPPAITPDGTLSFTPAAGASGTATVTVRVRDSGGSIGGGVDTSDAQTFIVTIAAAPILTLPGTAGDDVYQVCIQSGRMMIYSGWGPGATVMYDVARGSVGGVTFAGGAGNDVLRLMGDTAAAAAPDIANVGPSAAVLDGETINFSGVETVSFDGRGGWDTLSVEGGANLMLPATTQFQSLAIDAASSVWLPAGGAVSLVTRGLSVAGRLDLADNALILHSSAEARLIDGAAVSAKIKSAFNLGGTALWTGNGITTSLGGDGTSNHRALGVVVNDLATAGAGAGAIYSTFGGESVGVNDVLVSYALFGDADLSGAITSNDYFQIDTGFLGNKTGWINGDFDYDGAVTTNDYFLIDSAFLSQASGAAATQPVAASVAGSLPPRQQEPAADASRSLVSELFA